MITVYNTCVFDYYTELLREAEIANNKENFKLVEQAIDFVQDMEGIPERERRSEMNRWIGDETSAKRTMVVRRMKEMTSK